MDKTGGFIIKYNIEVSRGLLEVRLRVIRPAHNQEQPLAKKSHESRERRQETVSPYFREKLRLGERKYVV